MRKFSFIVALVFVCLHLASSTADAALLRFTRGGEVHWNVLGLEDTVDNAYESALEVTKIANKVVSGEKIPVSISNTNGKILLSYGEEDKKPVDISGYKSEIVEIEEKDVPKSITIEATASGFAIKQRGVTAETNYPITINSPENKLSLTTESGERFLSVLPYEAVSQIIRTNMITNVSGDAVTLVEKDEGEMAYVVVGEKNIVLLNVIALQVPITVEVSALTGSVVSVDQPLWYSVVDFLLT